MIVMVMVMMVMVMVMMVVLVMEDGRNGRDSGSNDGRRKITIRCGGSCDGGGVEVVEMVMAAEAEAAVT